MSMDLVAGKDSGATGRNKDHRETQTSLGGRGGREVDVVCLGGSHISEISDSILNYVLHFCLVVLYIFCHLGGLGSSRERIMSIKTFLSFCHTE